MNYLSLTELNKNNNNNNTSFYDQATACCNVAPSLATLDSFAHWSTTTDPLPLATAMGHRTKPWPVYRQEIYMVVLLVVVHVAVGVVGVVNNSLVVLVIYRDVKMRTVTNYFIANLALADVLVCIFVLPITLFQNIYSEWWCGWVVCKIVPYLQGVSVSASVNTLAAVALERYLAIFHPYTHKMSPHTACVAIATIWSVPIGLFVPWLLVYEEKVYRVSGFDYVACHANWMNARLSRGFLLIVFLTCYLFPLTAIGAMYLRIGLRVWNRRIVGLLGSSAERHITRSRSRILKMLVVVVMLFTVSWFPLYLIKFRILFGSALGRSERSLVVNYLTPLAQWMGASNSCVNPFVYCYFSPVFRREFREALNFSCCWSRSSRNPRPQPV